MKKIIKAVLLTIVILSLSLVVMIDTGYTVLANKYFNVNVKLTDKLEEKRIEYTTQEERQQWSEFLEKEITPEYKDASIKFAQVTEDMNVVIAFQLKAKSIYRLYKLVHTYDVILKEIEGFKVTVDEE